MDSSLIRDARVLVVEDDEDTRESILELLRRHDWDVDGAHNGELALGKLRGGGELPEAILLDLRMPGMDGWRFRAEQRRDPALCSIPVLAMSGDSSPQAEAVDAAAFLPKPLEPGLLVSELSRVVGESRTRRRAEAEAHRERLAGLGRLAAGVAHEINNPLAWITANLRLVQERLPELLTLAEGRASEDARELPQLVAESLEGATRVRDIVQQVRNMAQPQAATFRPVPVLPALESAVKMMSLQAGHLVRVVKALDPVPEVQGDPTQLGQLFVNLLMNAADAVMARAAGRGTIHVTTGEVDGRVEIRIADDGVGMTDAVRRRIFEPFFTTKDVGRGSGLGLFYCHGIVTAMGGSLDVESEVGHGTVFKITLPALREGVAPQPRVETTPEGGHPRLLVVEDEAILARALARLLGRRYQVQVASTVEEALGFLRAGPQPDAVLCDVHMPHEGGPELYEQVSRDLPHLEPRLVFMSGGALNAHTQAFIDKMGPRVVQKPLEPEQLDAALGGVLRRSRKA